MSLRFALLGLLARESLTGYDLTKRFDSTVGFFWSAKHSQIYPELAALTKEGLVTFEVVTQTSKPNKKVYTITAEGRTALSQWVAADGEKRSVKDPLLMRIWAIGVVDGAAVLPQLREMLGEMDKRLAFLSASELEMRAHCVGQPGAEASVVGPYLAMRCGQKQYAAYREWLVETIATLEQLTPVGNQVTGLA